MTVTVSTLFQGLKCFFPCHLKQQHIQEEGSQGNKGDQEVRSESHGNKGREGGCEAEQAHMEQGNPKCPEKD